MSDVVCDCLFVLLCLVELLPCCRKLVMLIIKTWVGQNDCKLDVDIASRVNYGNIASNCVLLNGCVTCPYDQKYIGGILYDQAPVVYCHWCGGAA